MNESHSRAGLWPDKLTALGTLLKSDAVAVVLAMRDANPLTYVQHNLAAASGWESRAASGAVSRAIAERAPRTGGDDIALADGRVAKTLCAVPISWQDQVIGALVAFRAGGVFEPADAIAVAGAAGLVAAELAETNALWRAQQTSNAMTQRERLRADLQRELAPLADEDSILTKATQRLAELFGADGVSMMLIDSAGDLVTRAATGLREDVVRRARRKIGEGISGWVAKEGKPLLLQGSVEDARGFSGVDPSLGGALVAPLKSEDDKVLGVVNVKARAGQTAYGETQLEDLASVAQDVAQALERAQQLTRLEEDRRQALVLYELSRLVMQSGDPQDDLETAAAMLADTLRHDVLGIWIAQANDTMLRLRAGKGYGEVLPVDVPIAGDAALQGAFGERRTYRVDVGDARPGWRGAAASVYVLAPILAGPAPVGVLVVGRADGAFAVPDIEFATTLGEYLGALVQRAASKDELQHVAAAERRRIAQELHDGLAQELTGVVLALEGCQRALARDPDVLPTQLGKAARDARACLADIRQYMTALRQQDAAPVTLPVTISRLADDLRRSTGLAVELEELGTERPLAPPIERAIVRIAQESLHNIAQHAQAARAKIVLHYDDGAVTLTVEDDGAGFPADETIAGAEQRGRFGILGMRERAESVGGTLAVRSQLGQGTLVQTRVPYDSGPRLNVVPAWTGTPRADLGEEVAPQVIEEDVEEMSERRGILGRLFGQR
ncbi:MAG TPA: GAF domain-containing sensor histidine kinase [Candidatus Dormibacteraeota bacterium]|nr:GAF domain-containing sensor histidine kinase [Candidatus Dormibacteraeota bacterium]